MPILDARHDLAHPVEGDSAWSESYYFNAYDPESDSGLFTRIGIRPNEGTMDVGMSLWLPGGELGEYRSVKEQREMVDTVLDVGAVRYEMLEALRSWRLTMDDAVQARPTGKSRAEAEAEAHPVKVALRDRKRHVNRLDLGYGDERRRGASLHEVADIDQPQPGDAVDRRGDRAVGDVELGGVDLRLIGLEGCLKLRDSRLLRLVLLLSYRQICFEQRRVASEVTLCIFKIGLVLGLVRFGLLELGLIGSRVDHR